MIFNYENCLNICAYIVVDVIFKSVAKFLEVISKYYEWWLFSTQVMANLLEWGPGPTTASYYIPILLKYSINYAT